MSFGYSGGDIVLVAQLAFKVLQNTKQACEAHDDLIQEVSILHIVLRRAEIEVTKPESLANTTCDDYKQELGSIIQTCERWLKVLDGILEKYNALGEKKRSAAKIWQRVKFGNGEMHDLDHVRLQLGNSYAAINVYLILMSSGSLGRVEEMMRKQGGMLAKMLPLLNGSAASFTARSQEGTILTSYSNDDTSVWKELRRELRAEGFTSSVISRHRETIMAYVKELGDRGALDELDIESTTRGSALEADVYAMHGAKSLCAIGEHNEDNDADEEDVWTDTDSQASILDGDESKGTRESIIQKDMIRSPDSAEQSSRTRARKKVPETEPGVDPTHPTEMEEMDIDEVERQDPDTEPDECVKLGQVNMILGRIVFVTKEGGLRPICMHSNAAEAAKSNAKNDEPPLKNKLPWRKTALKILGISSTPDPSTEKPRSRGRR
jgi:hypothetical protein